MAVEKICFICETDCAGRPRLKDAQGRYACQTCVEAQRPAKRKAPTAAVAVSRDDGLVAGAGFDMNQFLGDVQVADANPCPKCGMGRAAGAILCVQCGFDSSSGKAITTKVSKDKPRKVRRVPRVSSGAIFLMVALAILVLLPVLAMVSQEAAVLAVVVAAIWNLVAYLMMVVAAFRDDDKFWGIIGALFWIPLAGGLCWLAFVLYYCTIGGQRGSWKLNYWASVFAIVIVLALIATNYPDLLSEAKP